MLASMIGERPQRVVTIIDDDEDLRLEVQLRVEEAGFTARPLDGTYGSDIEALLRDAKSTNYVICDHQLSHHGGYSQHEGSEVTSRLLRQRIPTIIVSDFLKDESEKLDRLAIRHRFSRNEIDKGDLAAIFDACKADVFSSDKPRFRFYKTFLRVEGLPAGDRVKMVIPRRGDQSHELLISELPPPLSEFLKPGVTLSGWVNLNAEADEQLVVRDIELAAEPDPNDGLA